MTIVYALNGTRYQFTERKAAMQFVHEKALELHLSTFETITA